jgi:hypothetical protein
MIKITIFLYSINDLDLALSPYKIGGALPDFELINIQDNQYLLIIKR